MKKETVIIIVIVTFITGFVVGAATGIKFYASEHQGVAAAPPAAGPAGNTAQAVNPQDISQAEAIVRQDPRNVQALVTLGNLYFDSNQPQKAIGAYEKALAMDPKNPDVRTDMGIMYRALKDYDRAVREFREAASQDPTHKNSRFNLGVVLQNDKKDIKGAVAAWEDFLRVEPTGERADQVRRELEQLKQLAK